MGVKIISDSACDLPKEIINKLDIDVLPIVVLQDGKEYLDGVNISSKELMDSMREGKLFKTAQVPATFFEDKFMEIKDSEDSYIYIAFSSGLSGTYQTSLIVRDTIKEEYPDLDLEIVDSLSASTGYGLIVYKAAEMAKAGASKEEILSMLDFYIKHIEHVFTVEDIEYLFRGGRVSRTQAFVGGLLNIKPVLDIDEQGHLIPLEKVRGRKKSLKRLLDLMDERGKDADLGQQRIIIMHGDDLETAEEVKKKIEDKYGNEDILISEVGSAVGAHTGPGIIAIFFLNKSYN